MAINDILVSSAELLRCASSVHAARAAYQEAVSNAKAAADDLTGKWEGAARDAFAEEQQNAYKSHSLLLEKIGQVADEIEQAVQKYAEMERKVRNAIR